MNKTPKYDYLTCVKMAGDCDVTLEDIFDELDEYDPRFVLSWLANRCNMDVNPNIVEGTYTSVWDSEGEITSKANINLNTREVTILEAFDPADCTDDDGNPFECEILKDEYITFNGKKYPCHRYDDTNWTKSNSMKQYPDTTWSNKTGFYYK